MPKYHPLHFDTIGEGERTAWILHGILGSGRNWRSFARALSREAPSWRFVLPDLRNHGQTGPRSGPHDLLECAKDLTTLPHPEWVIGHSFGGKVALQWAFERGTSQWISVLDSVPFAQQPGQSQVMRVLAALQRVPTPAPDRKDLRRGLNKAGLQGFLVDWLLTSSVRREDGWHWVYDLPAIAQMMASYFATDFQSALVDPGALRLQIVRAARSDRWAPEVVAQLQALPLRLDVLADAGHWVHVDNPTGLRQLLLQHQS